MAKRPRLGLIGRVDHRGIGIQTEHYWHGLGKPLTLAVTLDDGWPGDDGRFGYDNVLYAHTNLSPRLEDRILDETVCRQFLGSVDVVLGVETTYEWEFVNWANEMGVKVFIVGNPEMLAHDRPIPGRHLETRRFPHPNWCWPTTWMKDKMPPGPLLPVPSWTREPLNARADTNELRIVHVAGKRAAGDRNGTAEFMQALRMVQELVYVRIVTQERRLPHELHHGRNVTVEVITNGVDDRWDMYADMHAVVLPRKYGGLCLPAIEALSCGLTTIMSDISPNETWPGRRMRAFRGQNITTPAGRVVTHECHPQDIAKAIDELARNRDALHDEMVIAREWAEANSWDAHRGDYWKVLSS